MSDAHSAEAKTISALNLNVLQALLDYLPRSPFFIKDAALRYVCVNEAMLALCGVADRASFTGRTARDFFSEPISRRYESLDRLVMRTQKPLKDRLELVLPLSGRPIWLLFGRWPIVAEGEAIGVVAIAHALEAPDKRHPAYERIATAIEYVHQHFGGPISSEDLSRASGMSVSQLERDFAQLLGMTPRRYVTKIRFDAALDLLAAGAPISDVAQTCGYGDQSAFTRAFRARVGMSPSEYRRRIAE